MSDYITKLRNLIGHMPIILCGATVIVVNDKGEILMQQRTDDEKWGLPGGMTEPGETIEETASREVFEETSIRIKKLELFDVFSGPEQYHVYPNGDEVYNVSIVYLCREFEGSPNPDNMESKQARFFSIEEIPQLISSTNQPILERFLAQKDYITDKQK